MRNRTIRRVDHISELYLRRNFENKKVKHLNDFVERKKNKNKRKVFGLLKKKPYG
jgi:hypothetical protein